MALSGATQSDNGNQKCLNISARMSTENGKRRSLGLWIGSSDPPRRVRLHDWPPSVMRHLAIVEELSRGDQLRGPQKYVEQTGAIQVIKPQHWAQQFHGLVRTLLQKPLINVDAIVVLIQKGNWTALIQSLIRI